MQDLIKKEQTSAFGWFVGAGATLLALYIGGYVFTKGALAAGGRGQQ